MILALFDSARRIGVSIMPSFLVTSANIAISDISLKLDSLGYISVAESLGVSSTSFT